MTTVHCCKITAYYVSTQGETHGEMKSLIGYHITLHISKLISDNFLHFLSSLRVRHRVRCHQMWGGISLSMYKIGFYQFPTLIIFLYDEISSYIRLDAHLPG